MTLLLDSSVIIAIERRHLPHSVLADLAPDEPVSLASITASELLAGVYRADSVERRVRREAFIEGILTRIPVVPFDLPVARVHAQLWAQLTAMGQLIGAHDLQIAASAVAHDYSVLTDNLRDFQRVLGLNVQQPSW